MTKAEIISKVAEQAEITKVAAEKAFEAVIGSITGAIRTGDRLTVIGFGTFSVNSRKARKGRNPRTGEMIKIPAKKIPKFSASAALKAMVNSEKTVKPVKKAAVKTTKAAKPGKTSKVTKPAKATKPVKATKAGRTKQK